jgi:hypothetical protein
VLHMEPFTLLVEKVSQRFIKCLKIIETLVLIL